MLTFNLRRATQNESMTKWKLFELISYGISVFGSAHHPDHHVWFPLRLKAFPQVSKLWRLVPQQEERDDPETGGSAPGGAVWGGEGENVYILLCECIRSTLIDEKFSQAPSDESRWLSGWTSVLPESQCLSSEFITCYLPSFIISVCICLYVCRICCRGSRSTLRWRRLIWFWSWRTNWSVQTIKSLSVPQIISLMLLALLLFHVSLGI